VGVVVEGDEAAVGDDGVDGECESRCAVIFQKLAPGGAGTK
jgi:hypothetical protein